MFNEQTISGEAKTPPSEELQSETADLLWDAVVNGATLKDIHGVPDKTMEGLYAHAYNFYQQGRAKEAETFFRFLCLYDMYNADYVMGLAATYQLQKEYQKAIEAYSLAFVLSKNNDYRPMLHAGQCHLLLKQPERACEHFTALTESSAPDSLKTQAQAYLAAIKKPNEHKKENHA